MAARTIEAKLVISGEDRASGEIAKVVKSVRQMEEATKVSRDMETVAKALRDIEQASRVTDAALKARAGYAVAEAGMKATQGAARAAAQALNDAKVAKAAFDGVKAVKGSEQAKQIEAATKAVRDAGAAYRKVEGDVRHATAAVAAQAGTMKAAEATAARLGADLGNLEAHQVRLRTATDNATNAVRAQIRVEDQAARAAKHHAAEQAEAARHRQRHGFINAAATAASGAVGVHGVIHTAERAAHAGAEVQRESVRLDQAGVPLVERKHIADESLKLAVEAKNVTQAGVMELWKELRSVMTDPHEVDHIIGPMVKAKSILDAGDSTGAASHGLNLLVKGAEVIGAAKDPERFTHLLDGYVKAMQVMGKTITPEGVYEMQKYSKAAGARWSDRFILTTGLSLGQEMGGSTAGNSIQMAQKQIVGGMQNLHSKAKEFARIGLIDEKNLDYLKTGEVKGVKAGVKHAVKGDDLAATDLDKWVYTILLPHLEKAGVKKEGDKLAWIQKNFTSTAADVISKMVMQRESFEAHAKMYEGAAGLKGQAQNRDDALAGLGAIRKSLEIFAGVVTSPVMKDAAHGLDSIAGRIGSFSLSVEAFNKAHPEIAKYEGGVAVGAGLAGAGALSAGVWKLLNGGFGLKGSAVALDASAAALTVAATKLGGGLPGGLPLGAPGAVPGADASKTKTGRLKSVLKSGASVAGLVALEPLAQAAQEHHIFEVPNLDDGIARAGLNVLDPRLGNAVLGDRARAFPSMAIKPAEQPLALGDTGLNSFGLTGPQSPEALAKRDADRYTRGLVEARKDAAPLNPGDELPGLGPEVTTKATESGQKAGEAFGKAIVNAPLLPPRPEIFDPMKRTAGEAATEAGTKVGEGIRSGIGTKSPEVIEQGQTLFQRIKELFAQGINMPINFAPGEGMGGSGAGGALVHKASLGGDSGSVGGNLGGLVRRSNLGGAGSLGGDAGVGSGGSEGGRVGRGDGAIPAVPASVEMTDAERNTLGLVMQHESHGRNTLNYVGRSQGLNPQTAKGYTAQGYYQMLNSNWRRIAPKLGIATPNAMSSSLEDQTRVALHLLRNGGIGNWSRYNPALRGALARGERVPVREPQADAAPTIRRETAKPTAPADEPRLVKGLDGKEGLDLGDGTMRMPDGAIRSIAPSTLTIPEPPANGFGGSGRGAAEMREHIAELGRHIDRFGASSFHGQIDIRGHGGVQATGMRINSKGALTADMGLTQPHISKDTDWA